MSNAPMNILLYKYLEFLFSILLDIDLDIESVSHMIKSIFSFLNNGHFIGPNILNMEHKITEKSGRKHSRIR